jgi:hypothetical protein
MARLKALLSKALFVSLGILLGTQAQGTGALCSYVHSWPVITQDYQCVDALPCYEFQIRFQAHGQKFSSWAANCTIEPGEHKQEDITGRGQCGLPQMLGGRTCYPEYGYELDLVVPQPEDPVSAWVHKWRPYVVEKFYLLGCFTAGIAFGSVGYFSAWECQDTSLGCPGGGGGGDQ